MRSISIKTTAKIFLISFVVTIIVLLLDSNKLLSFMRTNTMIFQNCIDKRVAEPTTIIVSIDDKTLMLKKDEPLVF